MARLTNCKTRGVSAPPAVAAPAHDQQREQRRRGDSEGERGARVELH